MRIDTKYDLGEIVFLKHDHDQHERMITGILARHNGVVYLLSSGTNESYHYEPEITLDKDIIKCTSN